MLVHRHLHLHITLLCLFVNCATWSNASLRGSACRKPFDLRLSVFTSHYTSESFDSLLFFLLPIKTLGGSLFTNLQTTGFTRLYMAF